MSVADTVAAIIAKIQHLWQPSCESTSPGLLPVYTTETVHTFSAHVDMSSRLVGLLINCLINHDWHAASYYTSDGRLQVTGGKASDRRLSARALPHRPRAPLHRHTSLLIPFSSQLLHVWPCVSNRTVVSEKTLRFKHQKKVQCWLDQYRPIANSTENKITGIFPCDHYNLYEWYGLYHNLEFLHECNKTSVYHFSGSRS